MEKEECNQIFQSQIGKDEGKDFPEIDLEIALHMWDRAPTQEEQGILEQERELDTQLAYAVTELFLSEDSPVFNCVPCSGTYDRDDVSKGQLSPMLKLVLYGEYASLEHVQEFEALAKAGGEDTALYKLNERWSKVAPYFVASFRIEAKPEKILGNVHEFGTGFSLSKTKAGSALHLRFTQGSGKISAWRGMHGGATQQQFESNKLPRFHLMELPICLAGDEPEMIDPMTKCIYDALHLRHVDVGVWELEVNARRALEKFESPKNPILLKGFSQILVPMSLTMEVVYGNVSETNQACAMVHYAMVEKLRNDLHAQLGNDMSKDQLDRRLKERIQMFTANCRVIAPEMKLVLKGQSLRDFFKKDKVAGSKQVNRWFSEMKRRIVNLISQKRDGEMFLGVGRVLGHNETMVAHSVSTFSGSSGGALFIIDAVPGCFIAVHTSPASIAISADVVWTVVPEHNLACNVENPVFGKMYFMHVLPDMTSAIVGKHREGVLCRFLAFHLNTILSSYPWIAWNGNQTTWLRKVVRLILEEPPRRTERDLTEDFNKASTLEPMPPVQEATSWGEFYAKWGSMLMKVGPECIKALGAEELVKKLHSCIER